MSRKTKIAFQGLWAIAQWTIGMVGCVLFVLGIVDMIKVRLYHISYPRPESPMEGAILGLLLIILRIALAKKYWFTFLIFEAHMVLVLFTGCCLIWPAKLILDSLTDAKQHVGTLEYGILCLGIALCFICLKLKPLVDRQVDRTDEEMAKDEKPPNLQ